MLIEAQIKTTRLSLWRKLRYAFKKELPFALGSSVFLWQLFFFYLPLGLMLLLSVVKLSTLGHYQGLTGEYFAALWHPAYFYVLANSFGLALITTVLCLILGFFFAYCIVFHNKRLKHIFLFLLIIPFWTNFILHIYAWFFVLEKHGFLNNTLLYLGVLKHPMHFLHTPFAMILMMIYFYLPFMVFPIYASLERFDTSILEASLDLGASRWQTDIKVLFPLTLPAIRAGVFLVFIPAFGEFIIPELMGGDKQFFVGTVISTFLFGEQTLPVGIAFTICSTLLLLGMLLLLHKLLHHLAHFCTKDLRCTPIP